MYNGKPKEHWQAIAGKLAGKNNGKVRITVEDVKTAAGVNSNSAAVNALQRMEALGLVHWEQGDKYKVWYLGSEK